MCSVPAGGFSSAIARLLPRARSARNDEPARQRETTARRPKTFELRQRRRARLSRRREECEARGLAETIGLAPHLVEPRHRRARVDDAVERALAVESSTRLDEREAGPRRLGEHRDPAAPLHFQARR